MSAFIAVKCDRCRAQEVAPPYSLLSATESKVPVMENWTRLSHAEDDTRGTYDFCPTCSSLLMHWRIE